MIWRSIRWQSASVRQPSSLGFEQKRSLLLLMMEEMSAQVDQDATAMDIDANNHAPPFQDILVKAISTQSEMNSFWDSMQNEDRERFVLLCWQDVEKKLKDVFSLRFSLIKVDETVVHSIFESIYTKCLQAGLVEVAHNKRVTSLTYRLNKEFQGDFDLKQLIERIDTTFQWYNGDSKNYLSPSFAIVQSSGMGKTKLMKQYKNVMEKQNDPKPGVLFLLCAHDGVVLPDDVDEHFNGILKIPCLPVSNDQGFALGEAKEKVLKQVETFVNKKEESQVVVLFDEAQSLVQESKGGFNVAIRWWLRQRRQKKVVAIFAGTLLSLSKYQKVGPPLGWTQDVKIDYVNYTKENEEEEAKKILYDPFYTFTTVAMEHRVANREEETFTDELHDICKCGLYGCPLFLAMLQPDKNGKRELKLCNDNVSCLGKSGQIVNTRLFNILTHMLLSQTPAGWGNSINATAS